VLGRLQITGFDPQALEKKKSRGKTNIKFRIVFTWKGDSCNLGRTCTEASKVLGISYFFLWIRLLFLFV
jgi:hypothetical protein